MKRTEFFDHIIQRIRFDDAFAKTTYVIEYNHDWYSDTFHGSTFEPQIDKVLSYYSYICYLLEIKAIREKEFSVLRYDINRCCVSPSVQDYLWNLYHFSQANDAKCSFQYLIDYGIHNRLIDEDSFYDPNSDQYIKVL